MPPAPMWWERLGGPNAISWPAWLLTLPGGVISAIAYIPVGEQVPPADWILLGFLAHIVTGLALLPARLTYLSAGPRASRPWATVCTFLVAGAIRGAFAWYLAGMLGMGGNESMVVRSVGAAFAVLVWFSLAALVVDGSRRHRDAMAGLTEQLRREVELAARSAAVSRELREELVARVQVLVAEQLEVTGQPVDSPRTASRQIAQVVDDVVRPLSHQLEQRSIDDMAFLEVMGNIGRPRIPVRTYLLSMVTDRPFAPVLTGLVVTMSSMWATITAFGVQRGVTGLISVFVLVAGSLALAQRFVAPRLPNWSVPARATAVLTIWCAVSLGVASYAGFAASAVGDSATMLLASGTDPFGATFVVVTALTAFTCVAAAAAGAVDVQQRRTESDLAASVESAEWAADRLRQQAWSAQRRLARTLHGDVQARLVALAARLRTSGAEGEVSVTAQVSEELRQAFAEDVPHTWSRGLEQLAAVWNGAIVLKVWVDRQAQVMLSNDSVAAQAMTAVIGEAITNAVRHGDADAVRVEVWPTDGDILITVVDDGRGGRPDEVAGGGSGLFDAMCRSWSRTSREVTTVTARIACTGADRSRESLV